jgi:hypothetical protein
MRSSGVAIAITAAAFTGCVKYHPRSLDPPRSEQQFHTRTLADPGLVSFLNRANWPPPKLALEELAAVAIYFNPDLDLARAQLHTAQAAILSGKRAPQPVALGRRRMGEHAGIGASISLRFRFHP